MQFPFFVSHLSNSINFRICGIVELWDISTKLRYLLKVSSDKKKYIIVNYIVLYREIIFLNDNKYFYAYLYWGKCPLGWQKHYTIFFFKFIYLFFFILDVYCYK